MKRVSGTGIAISGFGVFTPDNVITNQELCAAFNEHIRRTNDAHRIQIAEGTFAAMRESNPEFIEKASGIKRRFVVEKTGILDPERMCPNIPDRPDDQLSLQAEFALNAGKKALTAAGRVGEDIDLIILASSNLQRMYPAVGMEVQNALRARGFAYDISVGCSSGTFPIQIASDAIRAQNATCALLVNPEIMSGHANWRDRDSHFIFGDAATALVLEPVDTVAGEVAFEVISTRLMSKFSSNIRNNGGYLNRCDPLHQFDADKLFYQQGRRVFKDVVPMAANFIGGHLDSLGIDPKTVDRYWLHQANINMNQLIAKRLLGTGVSPDRAPTILDRYGNTASCGSVIAFSENHDEIPIGGIGCICSFGAGYSIGSVVVRRII